MTTQYYVTMTDKFMSGWGMARGKINKLVITCDTYEEAETVERNAKRRHEMIYVNIRSTRPSYPRAFVSWHGREQNDYDAWFVDQPTWK